MIIALAPTPVTVPGQKWISGELAFGIALFPCRASRSIVVHTAVRRLPAANWPSPIQAARWANQHPAIRRRTFAGSSSIPPPGASSAPLPEPAPSRTLSLRLLPLLAANLTASEASPQAFSLLPLFTVLAFPSILSVLTSSSLPSSHSHSSAIPRTTCSESFLTGLTISYHPLPFTFFIHLSHPPFFNPSSSLIDCHHPPFVL